MPRERTTCYTCACITQRERDRETREKKVAHPHPSLLFFPLLSAILFPLFPARVYRPTRPRVLVLSASYTHIYIYVRIYVCANSNGIPDGTFRASMKDNARVLPVHAAPVPRFLGRLIVFIFFLLFYLSLCTPSCAFFSRARACMPVDIYPHTHLVHFRSIPSPSFFFIFSPASFLSPSLSLFGLLSLFIYTRHFWARARALLSGWYIRIFRGRLIDAHAASREDGGWGVYMLLLLYFIYDL